MLTIGIHVIWTTYGTWLPGDSRGHWSPLFDFYGRVIRDGGQLNVSDSTTRQVAKDFAKEPPVILGADAIAIVAQSIGEHVCRPTEHIAKPRVFAAAIEATHVHLLFGPVEEDLGRCIGRIKGTTSSAVLRHNAELKRRRTWTAGVWQVFLYDDAAFIAVKRYIDDHNIRKGLPAEPYDWISSI
jgi:REP element-mobilizing transposase RayT